MRRRLAGGKQNVIVAFMTYEQTRPWAKSIARKVQSREIAAISLLGAVLFLFLAACDPRPEENSEETTADGRLYFPPMSGEWESVEPESDGWNVHALEAVLGYAEKQRSSGMIVLLRGRILAERYWDIEPDPEDESNYRAMTAGRDDDGHTIEDVASIQKSVISFLAGVAEGKGILDLEASASKYLKNGWSQASPEQEGEIKVRHLLSMASGLGEDLVYQGPSGKVWRYNTPVYSRMVQVLEAASGLTLNTYTKEWLTSRIGMKDSRWVERTWFEESLSVNRYGFVTTARDLTRFGLLILAGERWAGTDILGNSNFLERALSPSQPMNPSYGYLWWLNGGERLTRGRNNTEQTAVSLIPSAPDDLVAALGALGRKCFVVPSLYLVVTRLGDTPPDKEFSNELWKRLDKAAPIPQK